MNITAFLIMFFISAIFTFGLFGFLLHSHLKERILWHKERQQLISRIMAFSGDSYSRWAAHNEIPESIATSPENEDEDLIPDDFSTNFFAKKET